MGRFLGGLVTFTSVKSCWQSTVKEDKNRANLVAEHCLCRAFLPAAWGWQGDRGLISASSALLLLGFLC